MKIGIVTVQDSNNFGSFLQAYALQYVLKNYGHNVYFVRTRSKKYIKNLFFHIKPNKNDLRHIFTYIKNNYKGWKKYQKFQKEQECFDVVDDYDKEQFDLFILGSDEIWNTTTSVFRNEIFYGYNMSPVMAYAVSIGNASFEDMNIIPEDWIKPISPILVRDVHTFNYLNSINIKSHIVCDPTFLVDKSIFKREYNSFEFNSHPFILVYSYGLSDEYILYIKNFAFNYSLKVISVCFDFDWCDATIDCSALDFCSVIEKASYIFTSTFHGTIFSILNHKSFVSFPQSRKTSDLLEALGLEDRLVDTNDYSAQKLANQLVEKKIDYDAVDEKISHMRKSSLASLEKAIAQHIN